MSDRVFQNDLPGKGPSNLVSFAFRTEALLVHHGPGEHVVKGAVGGDAAPARRLNAAIKHCHDGALDARDGDPGVSRQRVRQLVNAGGLKALPVQTG